MTTIAAETSGERARTDEIEAMRAAEHAVCEAYGVQARERWLSVDHPGMRVRVLEIGEGPPVLHVHGGGAFGALHVPLAAAMPGRRHILVDRPGFGLSELVDMRPDVRGLSVAFLVGVLDALGLDRVDYLGHSIGSGMGMWLALAHPERVRALAFAGGVAMLPGPPLPMLLRVLAAPVIGPLLLKLDRPSPAQVRSFFQRFGHDPSAIDPTMAALTLVAQQVPSYGPAWRQILEATISVAGQRPGLILTEAELRAIDCPVAFAWGERDPMVSESDGRAAAGLLPNATFSTAGIGHAPWLDDAGAVARALEPILTPI